MICIGDRVKRAIDDMQEERYLFALEQVCIAIDMTSTIKNGKKILQLTHFGKDSSPVLSPNKEMIAFVRIGDQVVLEGCDGDIKTKYGEKVWIYNTL